MSDAAALVKSKLDRENTSTRMAINLAREKGSVLTDLTPDYKAVLKYLGDYKIKHGRKVGIFNAYGENFGNPDPPKEENHAD